MIRKTNVILSILLITAFALAACGSPAAATPAAATQASAATEAPAATQAPAKKVTITWWHISTQADQKAFLQKKADEYMAMHPNVTIEITVLENEAFKSKLTTVMQSGEPPDIFHSWGGGVLNEYAKAGLLRNINSDLDADGSAWRNTFGAGALGVYAYEGTNFGVPNDMGAVGFWYNKELFTKAGIENTPTTWTELLDAVKKLKAANITPIAIGEGDKWPGHFWWGYLSTRICGGSVFGAATSGKGNFTEPCFVEAGTKLQELNALKPFQDGFLSAVYNDEGAAMGNGKAAMELMGQWAPVVEKDNSATKEGIGDKLAWFPFPMVEGGAGNPADAYGGGGGFALGKNAPDEAVDFVKFLSTVDSQVEMAKLGMVLPVVKGAESGLTDPFLLTVQKAAAAAPFFQLYLDQALPPAVGSVVNDNVQGILAGTVTPEQAAQAIADSAGQEMK